MLRYITLSSLVLALFAFGCDDGGDTTTDDMAGLEMPIAGTAGGSVPAGVDMPVAGMDTTPTAGTAAGDSAGTGVMPVAGESAGMDMPPMAGTTPAPGGACDPAFLECYGACEDQNCLQGCFTNAPGETQTLFNAFQSCVQNSGCQTNGCVFQTCGNEYEACFGPLPMGSSNCNGIFECLNACPENDEACPSACIEDGTIDAQLQFSAIQQCFIDSIESGMCAETDSDCYVAACESVILECEGIEGGGGGGEPAPGSLSCGGAILCAQSCPANDMACQTACLNGLAPDQVAILESLDMCAGTNCAESTEMDCVEMNCAAELEACFPAGDKSCGEVLTCIEGCTDNFCVNECQLSATEEAQGELSTLAMCLNANMCVGDLQCEACSTEYDACAN